jgi:hypothetical protein
MKELEDDFWKEAVLKDFEKPTHQGFTEDVMCSIEEGKVVKSAAYKPLISKKQWLAIALFYVVIIGVGIFAESTMRFDLGVLEKYSDQLMQIVNENISTLWVSLSMVSVFFVASIFGKKSLFRV